ncbi:plasmid replication initiation protein [Cupriavidus plantarum]|uniref:Plasmid replication initiation protein n=2 Tax=Cupriavidus plantarum TaxID=942865 RepID=A0A316F5A7_9BURK|nr:plasmid replication initiation protein [Cupriavidus plantarum]
MHARRFQFARATERGNGRLLRLPSRIFRVAPRRHLQRDFFIADIVDVSPKDDLISMEHPFFALRAGDRRVRTYERNGVSITVKPGADGCATIFDKDLLIYCISQLVEAMNRGRTDIGKKVRFTAYDFLVTTNRPTSGVGYQRLVGALERRKATVIQTNIVTESKRGQEGFSLIDKYSAVEGFDKRTSAIEVVLPDLLWSSVTKRRVLTLSRDYFRLRKPLDRRVYELARKHCGAQPRWRAKLSTLHAKSGSTDTLRKFRAALKATAEGNDLPAYLLALDSVTDTATFYPRSTIGRKAQLADIVSSLKKTTKGGCG